MKKYILQASNRAIWKEIGEELYMKRIAEPVVWFGLHLENGLVTNKWKDCVEYNLQDYNNLNKGVFENKYAKDIKVIDISYDDIYLLKDIVKKNFNRHDLYGGFRHLDMDAIFYKLYVYLLTLIKNSKAEYLICYDSPHTPVDYMVYWISKKLKLKTIIFGQCQLLPLTTVKLSIEMPLIYLGKAHLIPESVKKLMQKQIADIKDNPQYEPSYMKEQKNNDKKDYKIADIIHNLKWSLLFLIKKRKFSSRNVGISWDDLEVKITDPWNSKRINKRIRNSLLEHFNKLVDNNIPQNNYVLYSLHYEPEATTVPDGGKYYEQLHAIIELRNEIESEIPILVKEHYSTFTKELFGFRGRSKYFYDVIKSLSNVYLVSYEIDIKDLIMNSLCVASIRGTVLIEALLRGKPSVIFGHAWFDGCPGLIRFNKESNLMTSIKKEVNTKEAEKYISESIYDYCFIGNCHQNAETKWENFLKEEYENPIREEKNNYIEILEMIING